MVPQRPAARDRAPAAPVEELSVLPVHRRRPESVDQAVDIRVARALARQRGSDRELLHQQRERRAAQEAERAAEERQEVERAPINADSVIAPPPARAAQLVEEVEDEHNLRTGAGVSGSWWLVLAGITFWFVFVSL